GLGFRVTAPLGGLPTAFRAEYGSGHPKVAFLAEYDALPGYGPLKDQNGHACGHNWIAANTFGACDVLRQLYDGHHFTGTIVYMGCPAEEMLGGKVNMVDAGCFDDIDAAMQIHIAGGTETKLAGQSLAIDSVEFTYHGVSSHAAGAPERGVNALDACYLMFDGVNALRQHVTPDARIHGVITNGGLAPNVVPALASSRWFVRAADRKYLNVLTQKVINCARGGAMMTGAEMEWRYFENSYDNMKLNQTLIDAMAECMRAAGVENINTAEEAPRGSSDVGNVAWVTPTIACNMGIGNTDGAECHEESFLCNVIGERGFAGLHKAVLSQAFLALRIFTDADMQKELAAQKQAILAERAAR
ncbi:MAG: M20 family metallopeptidase, partial [Solobacterium sp.]|nr:M20 family metallopeptidase [Solobacterium sp.]